MLNATYTIIPFAGEKEHDESRLRSIDFKCVEFLKVGGILPHPQAEGRARGTQSPGAETIDWGIFEICWRKVRRDVRGVV